MKKTASYGFGRLAMAFLLVGVALLLSRCGKKNDTPASGTFGSVYATITTANCAQCHTAGSATAGHSSLDLSSQSAAYSGLTSLKVTGDAAKGQCSTVALAKSADPTHSYMMYVLFTDFASTEPIPGTGCTTAFGTSLGVHNYNLTADEETSIKAWITNGVPNN